MLAILILTLLGRDFACECGIVKFWSGDIFSNENSQQISDPYTFTHILHGIIFYFLLWIFGKNWPIGLRLVLAVTIESSWEILENTNAVIELYRAGTISLGYYGDSVINSASDILVSILGFWTAYRLPVWASVSIFLLIESLLLLFIRDSLIINIIMLVIPIEAIKIWQMN